MLTSQLTVPAPQAPTVGRGLAPIDVSTDSARGTQWSLGHRPSLDALRGIAILLVMLGHFGVAGIPEAAAVGVSLFFSLSGYLITALILVERRDRGRVDLKAFYGRRARRLLPALAILLGAMATWDLVAGELARQLPGLAAVVLYVGNWAYITGTAMTGLKHTWSLAVEEQFYLVWPIMLIMLLRVGPRVAIGVTIVLIAISFAVGVARLGTYLPEWYGSDSRAKDLLLGCLVALVSFHMRRDVRVPIGAVVVSVAALVYLSGSPQLTFLPVVVSVPCAILVAWFASRPQLLAWRALTGTGRISYGLYLFHAPLAGGPINVFDSWSAWPRILALFAASYALAGASWLGVERRFLQRSHTGRAPSIPNDEPPAALVTGDHGSRMRSGLEAPDRAT